MVYSFVHTNERAVVFDYIHAARRINHILWPKDACIHPEKTKWIFCPMPSTLTRLKLVSAIGSLVSDIVKVELPVKPNRKKQSIQEEVVIAICHHISMTAGCGISLDILAQTAGYNKFYLSRFFQSKVGCTIHQYIDHCRSKLVKDLLDKGYAKKRISETLGFSSPTAFSRWLKHNPPNHVNERLVGVLGSDIKHI